MTLKRRSNKMLEIMSELQGIACIPDTAPAYPHLTSNLQQTKNETLDVVINVIVVRS